MIINRGTKLKIKINIITKKIAENYSNIDMKTFKKSII